MNREPTNKRTEGQENRRTTGVGAAGAAAAARNATMAQASGQPSCSAAFVVAAKTAAEGTWPNDFIATVIRLATLGLPKTVISSSKLALIVAYARVCVNAYMRVCVYGCVCLCGCLCGCVCVRVGVCVWIYVRFRIRF